jgi:hypothetical protein
MGGVTLDDGAHARNHRVQLGLQIPLLVDHQLSISLRTGIPGSSEKGYGVNLTLQSWRTEQSDHDRGDGSADPGHLMNVCRRPGPLSVAGQGVIGTDHVGNVIAGADGDALLLHLERNLMMIQVREMHDGEMGTGDRNSNTYHQAGQDLNVRLCFAI